MLGVIYNSNLGRLPAKRSKDDTALAKSFQTMVWMMDASEECRKLAGARVTSATMVDTDLLRDAKSGHVPLAMLCTLKPHTSTTSQKLGAKPKHGCMMG